MDRFLLLALSAAALPAQDPASLAGVPARLSRGEALLGQGRPKEAAEEAEAATKEDPESLGAWALLGRARYAEKRWADALVAFRRGLGIAPEEPRLIASAAICHFELHEYGDAVPLFQRSAERDPSYGKPHLYLARIAAERGEIEEAELEFRAAASLDPGEPLAHYFLGLHLFKQGRHEESAAAFRACLVASPDLPSAHLNLGLSLTRLGKTEEGRQHLDRFKRLTDVQLAEEERRLRVSTRLAAGRLELEAGRFDAALPHFIEALAIAPEVPAVHAFLAETYARLGRREESARERAEFERLSKGMQGR